MNLIGVNEAETGFAVFDGLAFKVYRVFSFEQGMEGIALQMECPDDPVTNWVTDTMQGGPDNWKRLVEDEEITDIRWIGKRDGQEASAVLIQTTKRRLAFGSVEKTRQLTAQEQADRAKDLAELAKQLTAQGGKVKKINKKTDIAEAVFFWEQNGSAMNEYEDKLIPPPGCGGEFPEEWPFRMVDAATFVYHSRRKAGFGA